MKRMSPFFYALACVTLISCRLHDHGIDITYRESGHYYSMKAYFSKSETRVVEEYMNDRIGSGSNMSFVNTRIDGELALDDHTTFYLRKYPGLVEIKLDKYENSAEAYHRIKSMCEGIKEVLVKK